MGAVQRWRELVEAEHAQSDRMRQEAPPDDHWRPYVEQFRADPRRQDDPLLNMLLDKVMPHHTVIDVGAGAGRLAIPLALRCRHLVAVEPSQSMASVLLEEASNYGIDNVSLIQAGWEDAPVDPGDIVLCAHVLYTVRDIEPFVRKLEAHARDRVLVVLFNAPPQSQIYPIWKGVHGEERIPLPSLPQFEDVLRELRIDAHIKNLPAEPPRGFGSLDQARDLLSRRLYVAPGSRESGLLDNLLSNHLEEVDGTFQIKGAQPLVPALVWWQESTVS